MKSNDTNVPFSVLLVIHLQSVAACGISPNVANYTVARAPSL